MGDYGSGFLGGAIIGLAVSLLLLSSGKVAGVSGIVYRSFQSLRDLKGLWRFAFLMGLFSGGLLIYRWNPGSFADLTGRSWAITLIGGSLVGFGTVLGNGCTSGHGVCGISRFSPRSLFATTVFIMAGVFTVALFRLLTGS